jgi:acyl-CoA reductase-like NAD-dependent aldehyde dehydrogenase
MHDLAAFGPVCTIESFSDFKEVVHRVNDSKFGLQAGVFTNDMQKARARPCPPQRRTRS